MYKTVTFWYFIGWLGLRSIRFSLSGLSNKVSKNIHKALKVRCEPWNLNFSIPLCTNYHHHRPVRRDFKRGVLVWPSRQFQMWGLGVNPQTLTKLWYFSIQNMPEWRFLQTMAHIIIQYLMFRDKINLRLQNRGFCRTPSNPPVYRLAECYVITPCVEVMTVIHIHS